MKLQQIVLLLMTFLLGAVVYGMDWQREQDKKMADLDNLIGKQSTLLQMRIEYDEYNANRRRMEYVEPSYTEEVDDFRYGVEVK